MILTRMRMIVRVLTSLYLISLVDAFENKYMVEPDESEECLSCEATVTELQKTWTDPTSVEEILKDLEKQCKSLTESYGKRKVCDKLAEIFVQIPPGIFEGQFLHFELKICIEF